MGEQSGKWKWEVISVLRLLETDLKDKKLISLCTNNDDLINDPDWEDYCINVIDFILSLCPGRWNEQQISRSLGMIRSNSYAVEVGDLANYGMVRLLFPTLSMINHSCQENARCVIRRDFKMDVYSTVDIAKGEEITISYLPSLFFTLPERQRKLEQTWFFQCKCCRCSDSTESGTHFSSVLCPSCREPAPPLERAGQWVWQCGRCAREVSESSVNTMRERMDADIQAAKDPEDLEDILEKYSNIFPRNYCKFMEIKMKICKLLGNSQYMVLENFTKKVKICEEVISVLERIDPGLTEWRGHLLYEKNWSAVTILQMQLETRSIKFQTYKNKMKSLIKDLELAMKMLEIESNYNDDESMKKSIA